MSYLVHLKQFEGPMDLLLYLIRKEEMDIFDININEITKTYLEYIRLMKELDLEVAGEFVSMAATLIYIKSQMLLPQYNAEGEVVEASDPRKELVQKLLEYQKYQAASKQLYDRPLLNRDIWNRGIREDFDAEGEGDIILEESGLFSLISAFRVSVKRMKKAVHNVKSKGLSIAGRILEIKDKLIVGQRILMRELLSPLQMPGPLARLQLLITFLSMLELGRMGFVHLFQNEVYGDIHVETKKAVETNVVERVQEFDSQGADVVANQIMAQAAEDLFEESRQTGEAVAEPASHIVAIEEEDLQLHNAEMLEQMSKFVSDDASDDSVNSEIATDEDILLAEAELTHHPKVEEA